MASKSLKIALIAILATFVLVGCSEKEPEYKVEGPKATDMKEVGGVASSSGATNMAPATGEDANGPASSITGTKGDPPKVQGDHK